MKYAYGERLVKEFDNKEHSKIEITTERFSVQDITENVCKSTQCLVSDICKIDYDLTNNNKPNTVPILLIILGAAFIPIGILLAIFNIYLMFISLLGLAMIIWGLIIMKPRFKIEARMYVYRSSAPDDPIKILITKNVVNILEEVFPIILDIQTDKSLALNKWATPETSIPEIDEDL